MKHTRYVLSDAGEVSVVRLEDGGYALDCLASATVEGTTRLARGCATLRRDEAGFSHRQWYVEEAAIGGARDTQWIGTQHDTLADAARALGRGALQTARLRATIDAQRKAGAL
jgi:hypothetical protein